MSITSNREGTGPRAELSSSTFTASSHPLFVVRNMCGVPSPSRSCGPAPGFGSHESYNELPLHFRLAQYGLSEKGGICCNASHHRHRPKSVHPMSFLIPPTDRNRGVENGGEGSLPSWETVWRFLCAGYRCTSGQSLVQRRTRFGSTGSGCVACGSFFKFGWSLPQRTPSVPPSAMVLTPDGRSSRHGPFGVGLARLENNV